MAGVALQDVAGRSGAGLSEVVRLTDSETVNIITMVPVNVRASLGLVPEIAVREAVRRLVAPSAKRR